MKKIGRRTLRILASILICFPALVVIFATVLYEVTPFLSYQWLIEKSVQIMWIYFVSAIILLMFTKRYWMFLSFGCCSALCLFIKNTSNKDFGYAKKHDGLEIKVANFNVSRSNENIDGLLNGILLSEADLLSIQEVNPYLDSVFRLSLTNIYPHIYSLKRNDLYGMMICSKYPFGKADTLSFQNIPNVIGCINVGKESCKLNFMASYLLPAFNVDTYEQMRNQLGNIAYKAHEINAPLVVLGTFNAVPWSPEIQDFKLHGELSDSRVGFIPTYPNNVPSMLQVPYDHIFHSKQLQCIGFKTIKSKLTDHTGIEGIFQFKDVEK